MKIFLFLATLCLFLIPALTQAGVANGLYAIKQSLFETYRNAGIPDYPFALVGGNSSSYSSSYSSSSTNNSNFNERDYPVACVGEGQAGVIPNWLKVTNNIKVRFYFGMKKCNGVIIKSCYMDGLITYPNKITAGPNPATFRYESNVLTITVPKDKDSSCPLIPPAGNYALDKVLFLQNFSRHIPQYPFKLTTLPSADPLQYKA
ncbi:MAG: hypothetical protein WCG27_07830, partial [Pseudomonadota bacterium]